MTKNRYLGVIGRCDIIDTKNNVTLKGSQVVNKINEQDQRIKKIKKYINGEIKQREKDLQKSIKAGMPSGLMYSEIELLEELRKIVDGDVE